jgi:hypothetical protein
MSDSYLMIQLLAQFGPSEPVSRVIHAEYRCAARRPAIHLLLRLLTREILSHYPLPFRALGSSSGGGGLGRCW